MFQNINDFFTQLLDVLKRHIILFFYSPLFLFSVYYIFFFFEQQKKLKLEHLKQQELFSTILREKDLLLSQKDELISTHLIRLESVVSPVNSDPNVLKYYALTVTIVVIVGAIAFIYFKNNPGPSEPLKPSYFLDEIQPTLSAGITQVANVSSKNLKPIFTKLTKEMTGDLSTQLTCSLESMEKAALANNNAFVHKCEGAVKDIYNNTTKAIESATNLKNREVIIQVDSQSIAKAVSEDLKAELNRMNSNHSNLINTEIASLKLDLKGVLAKNDNEIFTNVSDLKEKIGFLSNQYPDSKNSFNELIHLCSSIMNQFS